MCCKHRLFNMSGFVAPWGEHPFFFSLMQYRISAPNLDKQGDFNTLPFLSLTHDLFFLPPSLSLCIFIYAHICFLVFFLTDWLTNSEHKLYSSVQLLWSVEYKLYFCAPRHTFLVNFQHLLELLRKSGFQMQVVTCSHIPFEYHHLRGCGGILDLLGKYSDWCQCCSWFPLACSDSCQRHSRGRHHFAPLIATRYWCQSREQLGGWGRVCLWFPLIAGWLLQMWSVVDPPGGSVVALFAHKVMRKITNDFSLLFVNNGCHVTQWLSPHWRYPASYSTRTLVKIWRMCCKCLPLFTW